MAPKEKKESEQKKRIVLLDTHAILHRAYHALPEFASSKGEPTGALYGLITMIIKIIGELLKIGVKYLKKVGGQKTPDKMVEAANVSTIHTYL